MPNLALQEYKIVPQIGIAPILLGMLREDCLREMGWPVHTRKERDIFLRGSLFEDFGEDDRVEAIEIAWGDTYLVTYNGVNVFHNTAADVLAHIGTEWHRRVYQRRYDSGYIYPQLEMALWRWDLADGVAERFESVVIGRSGYFTQDRWLRDPGNHPQPNPYA